MIQLSDIKQDILQECADDHTGLWSVVREVRQHMASAGDDDIRQTTLQILSELLVAGEIIAGHPAPKGSGFVETVETIPALLGDVEAAWKKLGRDPTIGEIIWFTTPTSSTL